MCKNWYVYLYTLYVGWIDTEWNEEMKKSFILELHLNIVF
jgi:hypothetical protein